MQYFKYANVQSPLSSSNLTGSITSSLLQDADPCLYYMLNYYSECITNHILARWNYEVATLGKTELINKPLQSRLPYDPLPFEQSTYFKFPMLAVYRQNDAMEYKTFSYDHITSKFNLIYVLPPLDAAGMERLYPFLKHISRIIQDKTETNSEPSYFSGSNVWEKAGIEEIKVLSADYGKIPNINSNLYFPAVSIEIEAKERYDSVSLNYDAFTGFSASIDIKQQGETDYNIININKDL